MKTTLEKLLEQHDINEGVLRRSCEHLGIHLNDQTISYYFGVQSILKNQFVRFVSKNAHFFKQYQLDYYEPKSPKSIAHETNRDFKDIDQYLRSHYPICYINDKFEPTSNRYLKYVSSYEIDYEIALTNGIGGKSLNPLDWHLGLNQKDVFNRIEKKWKSA